MVDPAGGEAAPAVLCASHRRQRRGAFWLAPSADGALRVQATAATHPLLDDYAAQWVGRASSPR